MTDPAPTAPARFQLGGAVRADAWYGRRDADDALPAALLAGRWAAVLAPRQMGKSSLRIRTAQALIGRARVAAVDLGALGAADVDAAGWFAGLAGEIAAELALHQPQLREGPPTRAFLGFLETLLTERPLVLFLDEIDVLRSVGFAGDVLGALRAAHERGATDSTWAGLTVCLVGAVTPDTLSGTAGTPFNVGARIALTDFARHELVGLEAHYGIDWVDALHGWTSGHPYMTARLGASLRDGASVDTLVERLLLGPGATADATLAAAERELTLDDGGVAERVETYRQVLGGPLPLAAVRAPLIDALVLSGMVAVHDGRLHPRNRVFRTVFDEAWADRLLGRRSIRAAVRIWADGGRRDEDLPRGQALATIRTWSARRTDLAPDESRLLLRAGEVVAEEAGRRDAEARRVEAERVARTRGRLVAGLGALALALAGTAAALVHANRVARQETRLATALRFAAEAETLAATPRLGEAALDRALAAVDADPDTDAPEVTRALAAVLGARQGRRMIGHRTPVVGVGCAADGTFTSSDAAGVTLRWDPRRGGPIERWEPGDPQAPRPGGGLGTVMAGVDTEGPDDDGPRRLARLEGPGGHVLLGDFAGGVRIVDREGAVTRLVGHTNAGLRWAAFTPLGLLTLGHDDTLRRWDVASGVPLGAFLLHAEEPGAVAICGHRVVSGAADGAVGVWEVAAGAGSAVLDLDGSLGASWRGGSVVTFGPDLRVRARDPWTGTARPDEPDGPPGTGATEAEPAGLRVFQGDPPRLIGPAGPSPLPAGSGADYIRAAWAADGGSVAGATAAGRVTRWDVAKGAVAGEWQVTPAPLSTPGVGPDGRVAVGSTDGAVWVLGAAATRVGSHRSAVSAVAWSGDGSLLASASLDHTAVVWDVASATERLRLVGHASHVRAIAWSPDGEWIATGGDDHTTRLWDARTGDTVAVYHGHTGVVRTVAFSADGRWIVSTGDDRLAIVFPGRPDVLVDQARANAAPSAVAGGLDR